VSPADLRISGRFRAALLAKGALLLGLGVVFAWLELALLRAEDRSWWLRGPGLLVGAVALLFLVRTSRMALMDVVQGRAVRESGAVALRSRRSGYSLQLPSGRFVEFILWNPWQPLVPGRRYTVTFGRVSGVLVAPPEVEREEAAP
jgi:hypothetical protein